jgi:two-component system, sensor histidine kinase and response regulator
VNAAPISHGIAEFLHEHDGVALVAEPVSEPSGHILIVDDSPENLRVLSGILVGRGYNVRSALSGQSALRDVISYPPQLILIDIIMADIAVFRIIDYVFTD